MKIDMFARGSAEIAELRIGADSPMKGVPLSKLSATIRSQVLICAVQRDGQCITPDGNFVLQENDIAYVTGSQASLASLLDNLNILKRKVRQVLIVGGGRISYYLAKEMENSGIRATIVESDGKRCHELATVLPEVTVVQGDASSQEFLDSEGIENFDALVTLTGMDELIEKFDMLSGNQPCGKQPRAGYPADQQRHLPEGTDLLVPGALCPGHAEQGRGCPDDPYDRQRPGRSH